MTGSLQVSAALEVHRWESEKNPKLIEDTQKMIKRMIAREILEEIRTAAEPIMIEALRYAPDMHVYRVQEQVAKLRALLSPNV